MRARHSLPLIRFTLAAASLSALALPAASTPLFQAYSIHYRTHNFGSACVTGDFDADGHLDVALPTSSGLQVGRGRGDGRLLPFQDLLGTNLGDAASADLNADGIADLAVAYGGLAVRFGAPGTGLGPEVAIEPVGSQIIESVAIADVNGDGRPDLVTGRGNDVVVHLSTGPGTFGPALASPVTAGQGVVTVACARLDGDAAPDLAIVLMDNVTFERSLGWMKGNADGTFGPVAVIAGLDPNTYRIFLEDLNGDGHRDVAIYDKWFPGDGSGGFGSATPFGGAVYVQAIADVTLDGIPDLVSYGFGNPNFGEAFYEIHRGDGGGGFHLVFAGTLLSFEQVGIGDLNEDGRPDLALVGGAIANLSVHLSNGDGTFGGERHYTVGNQPRSVALADVTGDGKTDAITANWLDASVSVLPGLGNGQFAARTDLAVVPFPTRAAIGDLDGDGRPDAVVSGNLSVAVLLGQPGGGFGAASSFPSGGVGVDVALADMDHDGKLDAAVLNQDTKAVAILKGDGVGGLALAGSYATSTFPVALAAGSLNGDVWPDVAVACGKPSSFMAVDVLLGNGAGGLQPKVTYSPGLNTARAITIADATGDGILDVVVASRGAARILAGQGNGSLTLGSSVPMSQSRSILVADGDGDGTVDLLSAGDWASCAWIARGLGGDAYAPIEGYGAGRGPSSLALSDLNGDGLPDIVVADGDTNQVSVLLGNSETPVPALPALVSAEAAGGVVRLLWQVAGGADAAARVDRSESGGSWTRVGEIAADGSGQLAFEDHDVRAGADYAYRLAIDAGGREVFAGLVSVHVPLGATLSLAGARPNPASDLIQASFTLPDGRPARLELFDVSGRRVAARDVGALGPGDHVLGLVESRALPAGVYWLRLTRADQSVAARAALLH